MYGVVTLGAGIAGLSFSYHFNHLTDIYEKNLTWGGRCRSHFTGGFTFDEGIHVSFTGDEYVRRLFAGSVENDYREFSPEILNFFASHWLRHPVETNLRGLPVELTVECLKDFIQARQNRDIGAGNEDQNYRDWLIYQFGRSITENFHSRYTRKYWTVGPEQLTTEWVGERIYRPSLEEVLRGALADEFRNYYYIKSFRYPRKGGYQSFLRSLAENANIYTGFELMEMDLEKKQLFFKNGCKRNYDILVSSLPLPALVSCIKDCPGDVRDAAGRLSHTGVILVNLGVNRRNRVRRCHWFYIYDESILPARVYYSDNLSEANAPPGCMAIQAEIYYSKYKPLDLSPANIMENIVQSFIDMDVLDKENIMLVNYRDLHYANVIFDRDYRKSRGVVLDFLQKNDIYCVGRYGQWAYLWSDQSLLSGKRAAEEIWGIRNAN